MILIIGVAWPRWSHHLSLREPWVRELHPKLEALSSSGHLLTNITRSYKLVALKLVTPGEEHLQKHYEDLKDKPFFPGLIKCM